MGEVGFHSREVMSRFLSVTLNRMLQTHHHLLTWLSEDVCGPRFSNFSLFPSGPGVPNVQQRPLEIQLTNSSGMSAISVQKFPEKILNSRLLIEPQCIPQYIGRPREFEVKNFISEHHLCEC